jgi:hypothetical protein
VLHLMRHRVTSRIMPRTTLEIDASVLTELRRRGEAEHKSMGQLASELLASALAAAEPAAAPSAFRWNAADLGTPRVDLEDEDALQRALDDEA